MNQSILFALRLAEGPLFRCAFALLVLGSLRAALLAITDAAGGYLTAQEPGAFWRKIGLRFGWVVSPALVLGRRRLGLSRALFGYQLGLNAASLIFRLGVVIVPAFMVAHVYLWERALGLSWPALPGRVADVLAVITIVAGVAVFLGRIYSAPLRQLEPAWTFFKPLILLAPLATGFLAMHPTWSPIDYHLVRFLHVVSACVVFVLIPFARLLAYVHKPVTALLPEAAWSAAAPVERRPATSSPMVPS